jgi:hypothetical protein
LREVKRCARLSPASPEQDAGLVFPTTLMLSRRQGARTPKPGPPQPFS